MNDKHIRVLSEVTQTLSDSNLYRNIEVITFPGASRGKSVLMLAMSDSKEDIDFIKSAINDALQKKRQEQIDAAIQGFLDGFKEILKQKS